MTMDVIQRPRGQAGPQVQDDAAAQPRIAAPPKTAPRPEFNWAIYADATLAGLSPLIPVPFVDNAFEGYFRDRMVRTIAQQRSRALHPTAYRALTRNRFADTLKGVIKLPLNLTVGLAMKLSRKVLYALSVKRSVDALSYYWRRAYLIDYMIRKGHLSSEETALIAVAALDEVLEQSGSGPFRWAAQQVVNNTPHVVQALWDARHGQEDEFVLGIRTYLAERWPELTDYLKVLARRYDEQYSAMQQLARTRTDETLWSRLSDRFREN